MKWSEFRKRLVQWSWLADITDSFFSDPLGDPEISQCRRRDFVRNTLEYVAPRPWNTLDLLTPIERPSTDGVFWQIAWSSKGLQKCQMCYHHGQSLLDSIVKIAQAHQAFSIDSVTKVTSKGGGGKGRKTVCIEIYEVPWHLREFPLSTPIPPELLRKRSRHEIEATRAYMAGGPMPPIVPDVLWRVEHP